MEIIVDDLTGPEIAAFIEEHIEEMKAVTLSPESKHALDLDGLRAADVTFWTMIEEGEILGCGAIMLLGHDHAEIKSMRVTPMRRHRGLGSALLRHIIAESRRMGITRLSLETGSFAFSEPARRLYLKHGFEYCGPFGDYEADPNSVFMTRTL
jgi:putative acetyltransferase